MKAAIVTMTPQLAKDYLQRNTQNRKVKKNSLNFYINQMIKGEWKENGEPIIIDVNGVVKDGQHRLLAVAESGISYRVPIISGINPEVMDTIDTGTNRTAADVLELEGFKYSTLTAGIVKKLLHGKITTGSTKHLNVSNSDILSFSYKNKIYLEEICKETQKIASLQVLKVLSPSSIGFYLHTYGNNEKTIKFLKMITGTIREAKTATDYVYKKLAESKTGKLRLSEGDVNDYIISAFLKFTQGNPEVRSLNLKKRNK